MLKGGTWFLGGVVLVLGIILFREVAETEQVCVLVDRSETGCVHYTSSRAGVTVGESECWFGEGTELRPGETLEIPLPAPMPELVDPTPLPEVDDVPVSFQSSVRCGIAPIPPIGCRMVCFCDPHCRWVPVCG